MGTRTYSRHRKRRQRVRNGCGSGAWRRDRGLVSCPPAGDRDGASLCRELTAAVYVESVRVRRIDDDTAVRVQLASVVNFESSRIVSCKCPDYSTEESTNLEA